MRELHLTKKDFRLEWFSGTGGGGQNRNKRMNCCRITHIETGIMVTGQTERDRAANQNRAFRELVRRIVEHYRRIDTPTRVISTEVIRNYHAERNEVLDKASGLRRPYKDVVESGDLAEMIEARKSAMESP